MKIYRICMIILLLFSPTLQIQTIQSNLPSNDNLSQTLIPHEPIIMEEDVIVLWHLYANGSGTLEDPFIIENYNITYTPSYDKYFGIKIDDSSKYFIIRNCFISGFWAGITITDCFSTNIRIENVVISNSLYDAITVNNVQNIAFINNSIVKTVSNGFWITASDFVSIKQNTISDSNRGISLWNSDNITIEHNLIENNSERGINIFGGKENIIRFNHISNNTEYGINIYSETSDCYIHHNNFLLNNPNASSQCSDSGRNNVWYDKSTNEGNYWGKKIDGSYKIDGTANNVDPYPLPYEWDANTKNNSTIIIVSVVSSLVVLTPLIIYFFKRKRL